MGGNNVGGSNVGGNNVGGRDGLHDGRMPKESHRGLNDETADKLVQAFKLLADETRLRIVHRLLHDRHCDVTTLCRHVKNSQPAVSHHLALLRNSGLVSAQREGKHNYYYLNRDIFQSVIGAALNALPMRSSCIRIGEFVVSHAPQ